MTFRSITWATLGTLWLLLATPAGAAESSYKFEPLRSLTGDCSVSASVDPLADPSCPYAPPPDGPSGRFSFPRGVAVDAYGNEYVAVLPGEDPTKGRIDVFDDEGRFITELSDPNGPKSVAVDSEGNLYVWEHLTGQNSLIVRYEPTVYQGKAGNIEYDPGSRTVITEDTNSDVGSVAVDAGTDRLFVAKSFEIEERNSAAEGNALLGEITGPQVARAIGMAIDSERDRIYASFCKKASEECGVVVFDLAPPHAFLKEIGGTGPSGPTPKFVSQNGWLSIAVDEESGHFFIGDLGGASFVHEFDEEYEYVSSLTHSAFEGGSFLQIALSNSRLNKEASNRGYLFAPVWRKSGRVLAFEPPGLSAPQIEEAGATNIGVDEVQVGMTLNPGGAEAKYVIEYVTEDEFEATGGFDGARLVGEGSLAATSQPKRVSTPITGLTPGVAYRFRIRAENEAGASEVEGFFSTFAPAIQSGGCPNQGLRLGESGSLPDCRAFELATPADTASLNPKAPNSGTTADKFPTPPGSPAGNSLAFMVFGGMIPGTDATGGHVFNGDTYVATRTAAGWQTKAKSPSGTQAINAFAGGLGADHGHLAVTVDDRGSLLVNGKPTTYVRYPDGSFRLPGEGSLATNPVVTVLYISAGGKHILFRNDGGPGGPLELEPAAPPDGTAALYDRTPDGVLHVVSLLPGEVTPPADKSVHFEGSSADGSAVAFRINSSNPLNDPLYLRVDNSATVVAAPPEAQFAGLSDDGRYLFYMLSGDLHRFDSEVAASEQLTGTGDVDPVNIGADGTGVYFLSPTALATAPNPVEDEPQPGAQNLYRWSGDATQFVATITGRDAEGETKTGMGFNFNGLGLWLDGLSRGMPGILASRATPDGSAILFESRADLTGFSSAGKAQVYRYDGRANTLDCVSCSPTQTMPTGDSKLGSFFYDGRLGLSGLNFTSLIPNLSPDGNRAFFETRERLVVGDNDGLMDVYEWEAEGKGTCAEPYGCLFLISSGQSAKDDHLFGVSRSGEDVFVITADLLVPEDKDEALSVYDARVGGGFPPPATVAGECLGGACQPVAAAPDDVTPTSASFRGQGNVRRQVSRCPKGRRKVRKQGQVRCIRPRGKKHQGKNKRTARRSSADRRAHR